MPGTVSTQRTPSPDRDRPSRPRSARRYGWEQPSRWTDTWLPKVAVALSVFLLGLAVWLVCLARPWAP